MLRYCGVCKDYVESEGHTHPEKECQVCHQVKKLAEFPAHRSLLIPEKIPSHFCEFRVFYLYEICSSMTGD